MPLVKTVLEGQILAAFQKMTTGENDLAKAQQDLAKDLATAIDAYIKTATVIVSPGQVVTGTAGPVPVVAATVSPSAPAIIT
jgi:hypothetical protein